MDQGQLVRLVPGDAAVEKREDVSGRIDKGRGDAGALQQAAVEGCQVIAVTRVACQHLRRVLDVIDDLSIGPDPAVWGVGVGEIGDDGNLWIGLEEGVSRYDGAMLTRRDTS